MQDKERIARDLAAVVGTDSVVVDSDELRVYETDGLTHLLFKINPDPTLISSRSQP